MSWYDVYISGRDAHIAALMPDHMIGFDTALEILKGEKYKGGPYDAISYSARLTKQQVLAFWSDFKARYTNPETLQECEAIEKRVRDDLTDDGTLYDLRIAEY